MSGEGDNRNYDLDSEVVNVYLRNNVVSSLTIRTIYKRAQLRDINVLGQNAMGYLY